MCVKEISSFVKNLHLLVLPSTLWAVHVDPRQEFLAVLHINATSEKVTLDKGVLLTTENCSLKTSVSVNDEIIHLPVASKVETISDLTSLIYSLHDVKICLNANIYPDKCSKYIINSTSNLCDFCSFEVFSETCKDVKQIPEIYIENANFQSEVEADAEVVTQEEKPKYLCTICGKTFACSSGLDHHMLTHAPPDDKPFKCQVCMKSFAKKYNLNVHARVHSGEKPYVCSKCGKTYTTSSNLSTHMNSAHCDKKRHHCELCEMTFVHPRFLRIHMRKHTGEKPFMCEICGKVFSKKIHVTVHMRTHTGEKPYVCSSCGKACTTTGNLKTHKKIHHKI